MAPMIRRAGPCARVFQSLITRRSIIRSKSPPAYSLKKPQLCCASSSPPDADRSARQVEIFSELDFARVSLPYQTGLCNKTIRAPVHQDKIVRPPGRLLSWESRRVE